LIGDCALPTVMAIRTAPPAATDAAANRFIELIIVYSLSGPTPNDLL
jgi:hypothetical protein